MLAATSGGLRASKFDSALAFRLILLGKFYPLKDL
jgi:hypothetical protein